MAAGGGAMMADHAGACPHHFSQDGDNVGRVHVGSPRDRSPSPPALAPPPLSAPRKLSALTCLIVEGQRGHMSRVMEGGRGHLKARA